MILILADSADPWAALVNRELRRNGTEVVWVEPSQLLDRVILNWPVQAPTEPLPGWLTIDGDTVALQSLNGVFARLSMPLFSELEQPSADNRDVLEESSAAWPALLNTIPCPVINRPAPGGRSSVPAGSRDLASLAGRYGCRFPPARFMTSLPDALTQFAAWEERVYLKPLGFPGTGEFLAGRRGAEEISRRTTGEGVSMQAVPSGLRITIYVVGGEAVASVVRAGDQSVTSGFPRDLAGRCAELVRDLELDFAECEFVFSPDGLLYCLDVSAMPDCWRCPLEMRGDIVIALAKRLSEPRSLSWHDSLSGTLG